MYASSDGADVVVGSSTTWPTSKIVKYTSYMSVARAQMLYQYSCYMAGLVRLLLLPEFMSLVQ